VVITAAQPRPAVDLATIQQLLNRARIARSKTHEPGVSGRSLLNELRGARREILKLISQMSHS